jgi:hypothetical protein
MTGMVQADVGTESRGECVSVGSTKRCWGISNLQDKMYL